MCHPAGVRLLSRPRRSLVDLIAANVARDPGDAPVVYLEADIMADDMERYTPTAAEPSRFMDWYHSHYRATDRP